MARVQHLHARMSGVSAARPHPGGPPATVLIVDHAADAQSLYGEYLEFCGFRVLSAADGSKGMEIAHLHAPDIILMDVGLPRVNGWDAIRQFRSDPQTRHIPVVAVSAYGSGDEPTRAREAGADVCLTKPCVPSQVARAISALLTSQRVRLAQ
jgi:two-component system cell cycle response regulator DivK